MKNYIIAAVNVITFLLVCLLLVLSFLGGGSEQVSQAVDDTVTIYGQGKIAVEPDIAYMKFGYENMNIDPQKAQDDNSRKMSEIIDVLLENGIKEENIQTTEYKVDEIYEWDGAIGKNVLEGYKVTNMINVKVTDIENAGEIVRIAFLAGGNVFRGISFDVENREQIYLDAMDLAIERAGEKAHIYAEKAGMKIIGINEIREGSQAYNSSSSYYSSSSGNYLSISYTQARLDEQAIMAAPSSEAISTGMVEITASVTIIYSMK